LGMSWRWLLLENHNLVNFLAFFLGSLLTRFGFGFSYYPRTLGWLGHKWIILVDFFWNCLKITYLPCQKSERNPPTTLTSFIT
jgi:hypothetical protein